MLPRIIRENPFFTIMAIFVLVGSFVHVSNEAWGSWMLGVAAGIGIMLAYPVIKEFVNMIEATNAE